MGSKKIYTDYVIDGTLEAADVKIQGVSLEYYQKTSINSGSTSTITSLDMSSGYTAAFFNYTATNGSGGSRSGTVTVTYNGSTIEYVEVSTVSLGTASGLVFSVVLENTTYISLKVTPATDGWTVKTKVELI